MYVINDSTDENVVDEATREVAEYMHEVKASPEMESGFMTLGHRMDADRKASREEERWQLLIAMVNDGEITIENAAKRLNITPEEFQEKLAATNNK